MRMLDFRRFRVRLSYWGRKMRATLPRGSYCLLQLVISLAFTPNLCQSWCMAAVVCWVVGMKRLWLWGVVWVEWASGRNVEESAKHSQPDGLKEGRRGRRLV